MNRIYEVKLEGGRNHKKWQDFYDGIGTLNGKSPGHGGLTSVAIVGTHHDPATIRSICGSPTKGFTVTEITSKNKDEYPFPIYHELIENVFLAYKDYPNYED